MKIGIKLNNILCRDVKVELTTECCNEQGQRIYRVAAQTRALTSRNMEELILTYTRISQHNTFIDQTSWHTRNGQLLLRIFLMTSFIFYSALVLDCRLGLSIQRLEKRR
jgi:hypothetical protein